MVGGIGREDAAEESFGGLLSFFGFFAILLLRCSPLGMLAPDDELNVTQPKGCGCCPLEGFVRVEYLLTLAHPLQSGTARPTRRSSSTRPGPRPAAHPGASNGLELARNGAT